MPISARLFALLLCAPAIAGASDTLVYADAYTCDADAINQDLVETCASNFPDLSQSAYESLAKWRTRNAVKARHAHDACEAAIRAQDSTAPSGDTLPTRQQLDGLRYDIKADFQVHARQEGASACIEALSQLATGGGALEFDQGPLISPRANAE